MSPLQLPKFEPPKNSLLAMYLDSLNRKPTWDKNKSQLQPRPRPEYIANKTLPVVNPIETLIKGFKQSFSQITARLAGEDYSALVKKFLPENAKLLKPIFPANSDEIQFADLDGDSQNELVASFRNGNEIKTIILKKQNDQWQQITEINSPEYDTLKFRDIAYITGEGKPQLLIGLSSKENPPTLHGFSLENNKPNKLFDRNYEKFEVLGQSKNKNAIEKTQLAIWNKDKSEAYDIELLGWNGSQLEPQGNTASYYYRKVVPFYMRKVKQIPYSPSNWYNLADALLKAELHNDASLAIDLGMAQDRNSTYKENFLALKDKIK